MSVWTDFDAAQKQRGAAKRQRQYDRREAMLVFYEGVGRTCRDVGVAFGVSPPTAWKRVAQARKSRDWKRMHPGEEPVL